MYEKRPMCSKRDQSYTKETYICEKRPTRETYIYEKRLIAMKRDIYL